MAWTISTCSVSLDVLSLYKTRKNARVAISKRSERLDSALFVSNTKEKEGQVFAPACLKGIHDRSSTRLCAAIPAFVSAHYRTDQCATANFDLRDKCPADDLA